MRRPPIACRRAVQSLQSPSPQHIWISDNLLTDAIGRFFPSSCPQQKRHGSHVPGPLEARRRAAKRRMTVSANFYPQENFSPLFSLGALFGFRKDTQPTWRYEAPSLQNYVEPLDTLAPHVPSLPIAQSDEISTEHAPSTTSAFPFGAPYPFSQNNTQTKLQGRVGRLGGISTDAVTAETHFNNFATQISNAEALSTAERCRSSHQAWISCRPADSNAWAYNVMVVKHLTSIRWDPTRILSNLKFFDVPPTYTPESLDFLRCLEASGAHHAPRVYHRLYVKMVRAATSAAASTSSSQDTELLTLVRLTYQSCLRSTKAIQGVVDDLRILANKIEAPAIKKSLLSELAGSNNAAQSIKVLVASAAQGHSPCAFVEEMLLFLPKEELRLQLPPITRSLVEAVERKSRLPVETCWYRLNVWLAVLENLDNRFNVRYTDTGYMNAAFVEVVEHAFKSNNSSVVRLHTVLYALVFRMAQRQPEFAKHKESLWRVVSASAVSALEQQGTVQIEEDVVMIFSHMRRVSLPYEPILRIAANLFASHANLYSMHRFLIALEKNEFLLDRVSSMKTRITAELSLLRQHINAQTLDRSGHHAFALQICQDILNSLRRIAEPSVSIEGVNIEKQTKEDIKKEIKTLKASRDFTAILDSASNDHALPQIYANLTNNIAPSQRTVLIHQLAHHYSIDATRSQRATWRSIYTLYNYLKSYSLPIGPLFTKAVVRAAIIRPMMEHRFISARRLIWVCQLVARVEGVSVAKQIENLFWRWRGDVIAHAKQVHVAARGDRKAKAMVSVLKQLNMLGPGGS
ncbi:hypothetical protein AA0111_g35 [Alternaria arborescens]|uniref:hypothetical protein n=1 Tax=Alternaria arborescens TaxID=156630 RepID=UPI001074FD74|nr:hypothetical protein AA0111_g35 [Alternaria arborescens]RYO43169.1 hypothetical protein AA0111_g35 [Alternaria arborescens]